MDELFLFLKSLLLYLLFQNLLFRLIRDSTFEPFVRPICGMFFVLFMLQPVSAFFKANPDLLSFAETRISYILAGADSFYKEKSPEEELVPVLSEYRKRLSEQLEKKLAAMELNLVQADFSFSEEKDCYFMISFVTVTVTSFKEKENNRIEVILTPIGKKTRTKESKTEQELYLAEQIAILFQLKSEQVDVICQKE